MPEAEDYMEEGKPWVLLLVSAAPRDHIVQLYQDQDFLNRAVCRFAGAALGAWQTILKLLATEFFKYPVDRSRSRMWFA